MIAKLWWTVFVILATLRDITNEGAEWAWMGYQNEIYGVGGIE